MILSQEELFRRLEIGEDSDFEVKEAGQGLPQSLWPTYSAFANTRGGFIVLGIKENTAGKSNRFEILGVANSEARQKDLWNTLQNRDKVNINIINNDDVGVKNMEGKKIIVIRVPEASRKQKPVYINGNPMRGTYKRGYEGDYVCSEDEVRRMLRDASDEVFDAQIFDQYTFDDLDRDTLAAYRQRFQSRTPDHPWVKLDDSRFLEQIGGRHQDRNTKKEGLTLAGLLMFGKTKSITEAMPYFSLDYQERMSDDPDVRWTHRITFDGRWEVNLFNFYSKAINRLTMDLSVPFKLEPDLVRTEETHVHEALREALVNCLIHADHSSSRNILIVKTKRGFYFSNPGRLRLPIEQIYKGGKSDCRNRTLQTMFLLLGLGEKAGSGISRILRAWREQDWMMPDIRDNLELEITECQLPSISMVPDSVISEFGKRFGKKFNSLSSDKRLILILAQQFETVTNAAVQRHTRMHPADIGKTLKGLVKSGFLSKHNQGRATIYKLGDKQDFDSPHKPGDSLHKPGDSLHKPGDSLHKGRKNEIVWKKLEELSSSIKAKKRVLPTELKKLVVTLCHQMPLTANEIAELTGRKSSTLYFHYLRILLKEGSLKLLYPDQPNRPDQAYTVRN